MMVRALVASTAALLLFSAASAFAGAISASSSNVKSPPTLSAPTEDQKAGCVREGGVYTKHADGKWYCDPQAAGMQGVPVGGVGVSVEVSVGGLRVRSEDDCTKQNGRLLTRNGRRYCDLPAGLQGDPIPGVDVSAQQSPGGMMISQDECKRKSGKLVMREGKLYCDVPAAPTNTAPAAKPKTGG